MKKRFCVAFSKSKNAPRLGAFFGGEGGIRTHGSLATSPHFECGALVHYATSPGEKPSRTNPKYHNSIYSAIKIACSSSANPTSKTGKTTYKQKDDRGRLSYNYSCCSIAGAKITLTDDLESEVQIIRELLDSSPSDN